MPRGISLSLDVKKRIIDDFQNGYKQADIAKKYNLCRSVISRQIQRFLASGDIKPARKKSGRPIKMSERDMRKIVRISKTQPFLSSNQIKAELNESGQCSVSTRTIRRILVKAGLKSRRPAKKPLLSSKHRKARIKFAQAHIGWSLQDWRKVIFSDESRFNLFNSDGIRFVRRPDGTRLNPKYTVGTVKHGGGGINVWGCFSGYGMGPLFHIQGIMDQVVYKDILENCMEPYADNVMPLTYTFMHDNDPKHRARSVKGWLQEKKIKVMDWPSQSPDLNPIENLWEHLDRKIRHQNYSNTSQLYQALKLEWSRIDNNTINRLLLSMPKRCAAVIQNKGYWTKY